MTYNLFKLQSDIRVHTPQPEQNLRLFPGYFQALKTFFQAVCVKYEQEASHKVEYLVSANLLFSFIKMPLMDTQN